MVSFVRSQVFPIRNAFIVMMSLEQGLSCELTPLEQIGFCFQQIVPCLYGYSIFKPLKVRACIFSGGFANFLFDIFLSSLHYLFLICVRSYVTWFSFSNVVTFS